MLYHNICNIWRKYKVQMSYKVVKILGMLFISCRLHIKCIQLYKYVVIKYISCCNYSKTYRYKRSKCFNDKSFVHKNTITYLHKYMSCDDVAASLLINR